MAASEEETKNFLEKMFKLDCDMDTSIRQAYIKGFSRGFEVKNALKKIQEQDKREKCKIWEIIDDCEYFTKKKWQGSIEALASCEELSQKYFFCLFSFFI